MAESLMALIGGAVALLLVGMVLVCFLHARTVSAGQIPGRVRQVGPFALLLGIVFLANKGLQPVSRELSWLVNRNITPDIHSLEGAAVATIQSTTPPWAIDYFVWMYVVGYVVLLVFPLVAYPLLIRDRYAKELIVAYALNYGIGLLFYTIFIAYGPRNVLTDVVHQPLFDGYPETMLLTSMVNTNTNVFPSLHTSLSVTVLAFAVRTRKLLPLWVPIATVVATSVVLSTMVLGIHWVTDVVVGVGLGLIATLAGIHIVGRFDRRAGHPAGWRAAVVHRLRW